MIWAVACQVPRPKGEGSAVHDYPLEALGPRAFEQAIAALALKVLGPGVEAFGSGPDGGREATYTGPVNWSRTASLGSGSWDGYVVIQAKQCESPADPQSNASWLRKQIGRELDAWTEEGSKRGKFPEYIIFATNVRLSSAPGTGGIDSINEYIRKRARGNEASAGHRSLKERGLKDWRIWHRDQINALLTTEEGVRRAFPAMLTAADVLSILGHSGASSEWADPRGLSGIIDPEDLPGGYGLHRLQPVLTAYARNTLRTERWVNFSEAGSSARQSIENVIIDLRADGPGQRETTALSEIIARGDTVLKRSMADPSERRHIVLAGGPGNGKSTISRFITQVYRVGFMGEEVPDEVSRQIAEGTRGALERLGLRLPRNRRWPIRVNLAELADDLGSSGGKSLLRWLSEKVSLRAEIDIEPADLRLWLRLWPWILILDGLDEVTSLEARRRIVDEIESFVDVADGKDTDADLMIVVTTRPTGYTERIAPKQFDQIDLRYLDGGSAAGYGRLVTSLRLADDLERRDQVLTRFERHLADPAMARLMKTPLQVLIMSVILERLGNLPPDRYQLFWRYYDTVYDREAAKNTALAPLLTQHRRSITELHEAVGLALQVRAETSGDSRALLPLQDLHKLTETRLLNLGYEPGADTQTLTENIVAAATKRLVLLVPDKSDTVAFEVRSLQELMAARALGDSTDEEIRDRMVRTAASPHWRNTWVFAAGRVFAEGSYSRCDLIVDIVETIDRRPAWPSWLCPIGPELAADVLDDGLAAATPRWQRRLIDVALRSLTGAGPRDVRGLARGLTAAATGNNRMYIRNALKEALAGTPRSRALVHMIAEAGEFGSPIPGTDPPRGKRRGSPDFREEVRIGDLLRSRLTGVSESPAVMAQVDAALGELSKLVVVLEDGEIVMSVGADWPAALAALTNPDASLVLELLCGDLDASLWRVQDVLADEVWEDLARRPVGPHLAM
jgi:hypothetical protein